MWPHPQEKQYFMENFLFYAVPILYISFTRSFIWGVSSDLFDAGMNLMLPII